MVKEKEMISSYNNINVLATIFLLFFAFEGRTQAPLADTTGLKLREGFSAQVIADKLGKTRHLVVIPQNDIYVRLACGCRIPCPHGAHWFVVLYRQSVS